MVLTLSIIGLLIMMSAFFSSSETALTAASRPLMHQLEQDKNARAGIVNRLLDEKEKLIGAILLGNNLVNILASALATSVMITLFGEEGVIYATLAMTAVVLVFAEILPKTYAFQNANKYALMISPVMRVLVSVLAPITGAIQILVGGVLRLFGGGMDEEGDKSAELRGAIALHDGQDVETVAHEKSMLGSILDLAEVEVSEIMTHRKGLEALDIDAPPADILQAVLDSPFTRIPLYRDDSDNVIGVLHAKALLRAVRSEGADIDKLDIEAIAAKPWFIPETTALLDQLQAFRHRREHFALVVDEYGSLMGIVTLEDILEEIVGDIADEHDEQVEGLRRQADGSYIVDGTVTLRDLNREMDWQLPDDNASTIAGLLLNDARRIPEVGQVFQFHGMRFKVLRRQRNQITSIRVTPTDATKPVPSNPKN